jgi:hypothetical protein
MATYPILTRRDEGFDSLQTHEANIISASSNGKTSVSGTEYRGSSPCAETRLPLGDALLFENLAGLWRGPFQRFGHASPVRLKKRKGCHVAPSLQGASKGKMPGCYPVVERRCGFESLPCSFCQRTEAVALTCSEVLRGSIPLAGSTSGRSHWVIFWRKHPATFLHPRLPFSPHSSKVEQRFRKPSGSVRF